MATATGSTEAQARFPGDGRRWRICVRRGKKDRWRRAVITHDPHGAIIGGLHARGFKLQQMRVDEYPRGRKRLPMPGVKDKGGNFLLQIV